MNDLQKKEKAIVIGGSIAGLLAARVLADHYADVLIVEKDDLPETPVARLGTPHAYHPHRFTFRGKEITERLFPGYEKDLVAMGAPSSWNKDMHHMNQYGSMVGKYPRDDIKFSRELLEWVIRKRVKSIPHVHVLTTHDVIGLATNTEKTAVIRHFGA